MAAWKLAGLVRTCGFELVDGLLQAGVLPKLE